ncbi:F-box protein At3g08750-like [Papaver somniferum]|uniref:F-box protein At3g08750-like n=1 Tax=Papaver somniferum TaxID=3469 RepID=UPI000E6FA49A|nr:F-box protein At3g08750-like [Papaver somniferum]
MVRTRKNKKRKLPSLPDDLISVILSKLSVKSICRFKCVCKLWYELFKNTKFIKMHLHDAIENDKFSVLLEYAGGYHEIVDFSSYHMAVETDLPRDTLVGSVLPVDSCNGLIVLSSRKPNGICLWNPSTQEYKKIPISASNYDEHYGLCFDCKTDAYLLFKIVVRFKQYDDSEI